MAGPLPLATNAFERYMLTDDRPRHPMTFGIRLTFSGRLDRAALESAVREAVSRHPLLAAHLVRKRWRRPTWVAAADPMPYVDISDESQPLRYPGTERIDLESQTGLRIWARSGPERTELRLQFHHSCTDGIGAYRFVEDLLCAYHRAVRPDDLDVDYRPLDGERLRHRTRCGLTWWQVLLRMPVEIWGVVVGLVMMLVLRPQPLLAAQSPGDDDEAAGPLLVDMPAHTFDAEQSDRLRQAARAVGATMNDLLLRDLLLASQEWNARIDPTRRGRLLRVMMPMNLRGRGDELLPACNVVAMVNVDRWLRWYPSAAGLLQTIRWETRLLRYFRFGLAFLRGVALVELIPGGLQQLTRPGRCYATTVLSNMGRAFAQCNLRRRGGKLLVGEMVLEGVESAPPVRSQTATGLTCLYYDGRLTVVQNYDPHHFAAADAARLLELFVAQLHTSAAAGKALAHSQAAEVPAR